MKNKFDYQSVPYGFAHCFHSQCIHKEECLHHLAAINCTSQYPTLSIINPNRIPADTTDCPYFRKAQKYRVAWGIRHLLDNVPHKCAAPMRNQLVGHFGKTPIIAFTARNKACFQRHKHISVRFSNNTELPKNRNSRDTAKNTATTIEASGQLSSYKVYF